MALLARRNFPTLTLAQLVVALADVEQEILSGKTMDSWNSSDVGAHHHIDPNLSALVRKAMILHDLGILDPATYPPATHGPIKRTISRYL